jgi:hypothetical protein
MIKKNYSKRCLLLSLVSFAQKELHPLFLLWNWNVRFKGTVEKRSMAGVAVEQKTVFILI